MTAQRPTHCVLPLAPFHSNFSLTRNRGQEGRRRTCVYREIRRTPTMKCPIHHPGNGREFSRDDNIDTIPDLCTCCCSETRIQSEISILKND